MAFVEIKDLVGLIGTAQAVYGNLNENLPLREILKTSAQFTDYEIDQFSDRYEIAAPMASAVSGFQAVLFRDKIDKKYVFAIRGSEELKEDFVYADAGDIGLFGFAKKQSADLYFYWKRLITPKDENVYYSGEEIKNLFLMASPLLPSWDVNYTASEYIEFADNLLNQKGLGAIDANTKVTVTGHSLGGNLSYVFASMFSANIEEVVTINAPGVRPDGQAWLLAMGYRNIDSSKITSVNAEGDLVHKLSGVQQGSSLDISQEVGHFPLIDGLANNHSVINGLDSLNLMRLFSALDPTQENNPSALLSEIMRWSSYRKENTYENMLDVLRFMIDGGELEKTPEGLKGDLDKRNELYNNMYSLMESDQFKSLIGNVKLVFADILQGKSDYGHFLALYFLSPFALSGEESVLDSLNSNLYELWADDRDLVESERNIGKENFSESWYRDRSSMLTALMSRNMQDSEKDQLTNTTPNDIKYVDEIFGAEVYSSSKRIIVRETETIIFGGSKSDTLTGLIFNDHLYGGGGNDTLNGLLGFDYLEGNAGNDLLYGGDDADHLLGGTGDDQLVGEGGNDILEGGQGNDTYAFTGTFGHDIIKDSDGIGSIVISGVTLSTLTQSAKDSIIYYDNLTNPTRKAILIHEGDTDSLIISTVTKTGDRIVDSGNSVTIKNWNSQLSITLQDAPVVAADTNVFTANDNTHKNSLTYSNAFDSNPNARQANYTAINATGTATNDLLMGLDSGKDTLIGGAGNDVISSGFTGVSDYSIDSANSVINNPGADSIDGGAGDDYIVATAGAVAHGGDDNDVLDAGKTLFLVTGSDQTNRDKIWQDLQQIIDTKPAIVQNQSSQINLITGLKFNKNLTATYTVFPSAIAGKKFIAKLQNNKVWIAYLDSNQAVENNVTYDSAGLWQFGESSIVPASGHTYEEFADRPGANLFGDKGDDYVFGGINADYLSGGEGKDTIMGGEGNDVIDGGSENDSISGGEGNDLIIGGDGNDVIWGSKGSPRANASDNDTIYGGKGNDTLYADGGSDYLDGGTGADELNGGDGDDYLYGGDDQEKDFLYGGNNNDTMVMGRYDQADGGTGQNIYIWDTHQVTTTNVTPAASTANQNNTTSSSSAASFLGFSVADTLSQAATSSSLEDVIYIKNTEGSNTLGFAGSNDFSQFDVNIDTSGNYLVLTNSDGNRLAIEDYSKNIPLQFVFGNSVEQLANTAVAFDPITDDHFLNGIDPLSQTQITSADLTLAKLEDTVQATGVAGGYLAGGLNNDTLTANVAGSRLIGGEGDDQYLGDIGDDTYLIRKGDGADTIVEKGGQSHIKLDKNIALSDVTVRRNGADLLLSLPDDQSITVKNMFDANTGAVMAQNSITDVNFYTGELWNLDKLKSQALVSTDNNDSIVGFESADVLSGGKGNDLLAGAAGNDSYDYALGDGNDTISDTAGTDTLRLGAGITQAQVMVRRDTLNNLLISFADGGKITIANAFDASGNFTANAIETLVFSDTSTWNLSQLKTEVLKNQSQMISGSLSDETLSGDAGNNTLIGNKGNDSLLGGAGDDIYQYALGDGNDVITDLNGADAIQLGTGITESNVTALSDGKDLILRLSDGATLRVKDMFVSKTPNTVDPVILSLIDKLQTRWISQAETLIEKDFGMVGSGDLEINFAHNLSNGAAAQVNFKVSSDGQSTTAVLVLNLDVFTNGLEGVSPNYYDRTIAHEMTHAVMSRYMNVAALPGWFQEGTAELIKGGDDRVKNDLKQINTQQNFEALFKTTAGSPSVATAYSVSYIAVKILDNSIRSYGGNGIRDVMDLLKAGNTLDQSLSTISTTLGLGGVWTNLTSFESYVKAVGLDSINTLLTLGDKDVGSLEGSDYGFDSLSAKSVVPDAVSGPSKHFNVIIPAQYIPVGDEHNAIESIKFSNGNVWNRARIDQEIASHLNLLVTGTSDNDTLSGTTGNDTFSGGLGNDFLTDSAGNDTYRYQLGDGRDVIEDIGGADVIELGNKISSSQYTVSRDNANNIAIMFADGGQILVKGAFSSNNSVSLSSNNVEQLKFSDGITSTIANYMLSAGVGLNISGTGLQIGTVNADTIRGSNAADTLVGGSGDDQLFAGQGQDLLIGGIGNDTYEYRGAGVAVIDDAAGIDRLNFIAGDSATTLLCKKDLDLIVLAGDGSQAVVRNAFDANGEWSGNAIENVMLSDGVVWDSAYIKAHAAPAGVTQIIGTDAIDTLNGTAANDFIVGLNGDDVINGGKGNDTLAGGLGNDVYQYALGDGIDVIADGAGNSRIQFSANILPSQVLVRADAHNNMVLTLPDGGSITFNNQFISNATVQSILFASDGTSWDFVRMAEEAVKGTSGNDTIYTFYPGNLSHAGDGNDSVYGGSGADTLHGDAGNDYLSSGAGADYVYGDTGNDILVSGAGVGFHELDGGLGDDTYRIERGAALTYIAEGLGYGGSGADGAGGVDTIELPTGIDEKDVKVRVKDVNNNNGIRSFIITLATGEVISIETMFQATNLSLYPTTLDTVRSIENLKFANGIVWDANRLFKEAIKGSAVNDTLVGFATDDVLNGGAGDDSIVDANGNDTVSGDTGNDVIRDSRGDDVYLFNRGDGSDQLFDSNGRDSLVFGQGITQADLVMTQQGDDMVIAIKNTSNQILVKNWFVNGGNVYNNGKIEYLKFANGDVLDFDPMNVPMLVQGDSSSNQLYGGFKNDTLFGGSGDDTLQGDLGNDILQGDTGNDYLLGGDGDDEYRFNLGDGNDIISDAGGKDKITLGGGITADQVKVKRDDSANMIISIDSANSIKITDLAADWNDLTALRQDRLVEEVRFANGDVWDSAKIFAESFKATSDADVLLGASGNDTLNGAAGNDTIRTGLGNDQLTGGIGNDYLDGGDGDDTYYYITGDGDDGISDASGVDTLEFGAGILPTDIKVARDEYNLSLTVKNTTHITVNNFFVGTDVDIGGAAQGIESIKFSNAVWGVSDIKSKFSLTGTSSANTIYGYETNDQLDGAAGNDTLFGGGGNDTLIGGVGNDQLYGGFGDDVLQGGDGADQFYDYTGNNIYVGGKGNDWFAKSNGSETYKFSVGDGVDYISSNYSGDLKRFGVGQDKIQFSAEITPEKLYFSRSYDDLLISVIGTTDSIQVSNYFVTQVNNVNPTNGQIVFDSNGASWDYARVGTEANKLKTILDATYSSIKGVASANATISASFMQNGQKVELGSVVTAADGSYTLSFSSALSAPDTLAVKLIDPVTHAESSVVVMKTPDWIAPAQPTAVFDAAYKVLSGSAEAGSTVRITNKNTSEVFTTTANASNQYSYTFNSPLVNKETVEVVAIDASLNVSAAKTLTTPDQTKPGVPTGSFQPDGKTITGFAEPGSTVTFKNSGGTALPTTVTTITANATTGAYTAILKTALLDYQLVSIFAKDAAQNTSDATTIHAPDTTKPPVTNLVLDSTTYKTITGKSEPGSTITVKNKGTNEVLPGAVVNASGAFTVNLNVPLKNKELIEITATDISGNVSLPATLQAPDKTPPVIQSAAFDPTGKYINGTTEANSNIIVKNASDVQIGTIKADSSGNFKVTLGVALTHKETVKVYAQDDVLNTSPATSIQAPLLAAARAIHLNSLNEVSIDMQLNSLIQTMAAFSPSPAAESHKLVSVYDHQSIILASQS